MTAIDHVRYLAKTIGPRGSTTSQEAEAAQYAAQVLRDAGLEPVTETFTSARSAWHPYSLFSGLVLVSEFLFWIGQRWGAIAALVLVVLMLVSVLLELAFRSNPLRWVLPKGSSQNVWVRLSPGGQVRQQVVLLGHLDTHRTPLAFSSDRWLKLYRSLVPVGLISTVLLIIIFAVGIAAYGWLWRLLSLPFCLIALGLFVHRSGRLYSLHRRRQRQRHRCRGGAQRCAASQKGAADPHHRVDRALRLRGGRLLWS